MRKHLNNYNFMDLLNEMVNSVLNLHINSKGKMLPNEYPYKNDNCL
jgi:hypothetical protein